MINSIISILFGILKFFVYKLIYYKRLYFKFLPKVRFSTDFYIEKNSVVFIGKNFKSRRNVSFYTLNKGNLIIGNNVFFNDNCMISCREKITIGNDCLFGNNVSIYDNDHDYKNNLLNYVCKNVTIGNNVWVGCNTTILKGVSIGNNCVIAAGSIITKDIPDNSVVTTKLEQKIKTFDRDNK